MNSFKTIVTPIGPLTLVSDGKYLTNVIFGDEKEYKTRKAAKKTENDTVLNEAEDQLKKYFSGKLKKFSLPLKPEGTDFQLKAWLALREIPYGKTATYGDQAARMGDRKKARAVGGANGQNPLAIVVPCHRVIGKDGTLTGFGGGLKVKQFLLDLECENGARN